MPKKARTAVDEINRDDESQRLRVQLDFSAEAYARLRQIKQMSDAKSNAEAIKNALRVYEWFLRQRESDFSVHLVKGDTVKEVELIL